MRSREDGRMVVYEGIGILPQPRELQAGAWKADFTLIEDREVIETKSYYGENVYPTWEEAKRAALDSARRIIDEP